MEKGEQLLACAIRPNGNGNGLNIAHRVQSERE